MLNCLKKYSQTPVWQLCVSRQILDLVNFQNNLTWPNSNTAGNSLDSRLKYSNIETVSPEGTFCDTVQIPSSVGDMELI